MKKAINVENERILSVADVSAVTNSPNGLKYVEVDWVDAPALDDNMQVAYPMYDGVKMFWQVVNYQTVASDMLVENLNLRNEVARLNSQLAETERLLIETKNELATTQEALDVMLMGV